MGIAAMGINTMEKEQLIAKFESRRAHVVVIGMGYVGLPLALTFAQAGYKVTGIDVSQKRVEMLNRGVSPIEDISDAELTSYIARSAMAQTTGAHSAKALAAEAHTLAAPTLNGDDQNDHTNGLNGGSLWATTDYSILTE